MILVVLFCNKLGHYLVSSSNPRGHLKVSGKLLIQGNAKMFLNSLLLAGCPCKGPVAYQHKMENLLSGISAMGFRIPNLLPISVNAIDNHAAN